MDYKRFCETFLQHYLAGGMGAMGKRDIDALVMHLLDQIGMDAAGPLQGLSNQQASIRLRASVSRIKSLRYEAALKYTADSYQAARWKLLQTLAKAQLDIDAGKVVFMLEDTFTRQWLQGLLKENGLVFDTSFNNELIKLKPEALAELVGVVYDHHTADALRQRLAEAQAAQHALDFAALRSELIHNAITTLGDGISSAAVDQLLALVKAG